LPDAALPGKEIIPQCLGSRRLHDALHLDATNPNEGSSAKRPIAVLQKLKKPEFPIVSLEENEFHVG
jgi:hypothetical protein